MHTRAIQHCDHLMHACDDICSLRAVNGLIGRNANPWRSRCQLCQWAPLPWGNNARLGEVHRHLEPEDGATVDCRPFGSGQMRIEELPKLKKPRTHCFG